VVLDFVGLSFKHLPRKPS